MIVNMMTLLIGGGRSSESACSPYDLPVCASVRWATVLGSVLAFVLLCVFSLNANAVPSGTQSLTDEHFGGFRASEPQAAVPEPAYEKRGEASAPKRSIAISASTGQIEDSRGEFVQPFTESNNQTEIRVANLLAIVAAACTTCVVAIRIRRGRVCAHQFSVDCRFGEGDSPSRFPTAAARRASGSATAGETPLRPVNARLKECLFMSRDLFDHSYLNALSDEGVNLHTFLCGWRQAMHDDLVMLQAAYDAHDVEALSATLHRLSGAVGLVGAHDLMGALHRASASSSKSLTEADEVGSLLCRARLLIAQLDAHVGASGSGT